MFQPDHFHGGCSIDVETCSECGGEVRIIASIEDPVVIRKIIDHLDETPAGYLLESDLAHPRTGPERQ
jgi:hypothetical protein